MTHETYLETEVLTATPHRLHLMLIEGALRFGHRARQLLENDDREQAGEALIRCQQIVAQLMAGLNREQFPDLAPQIASVYFFAFRCLIDAHLQHDLAQLNDALSVLAVEQETWRQVCRKFGSRLPEADAGEGLKVQA
jgi:flagellar protein FliS